MPSINPFQVSLGRPQVDKALASDEYKRQVMALELLGKQAGSTEPVYSPWLGAAKLASGALSGWLKGKSQSDEATRQADMWKAVGDNIPAAFGLGGAAAPATPAMPPTEGATAAAAQPTSDNPMNALDAVMKFESGGKNIHQNIVPAGGGFNPSTGTVTGPSSAQGYFQMITPTWRRAAEMAGIDTTQFPTAMSAPYEAQRKAASALYAKEGFAPWAPYNASLRAHIAKNGGASAFTNDGTATAQADLPSSEASPVEGPSGQPGFAVPPRPVQSIEGDDPVKLRADAERYAQTNPEASRQLLARADAAQGATAPQAAPMPMPPSRPADLAAALQAPPAPMTANNFNAIQEGQPLDPVFKSEGIGQPWMGTALAPQEAMPARTASAGNTMPPPRPADLARAIQADMPAPGAVPAIGQMPQAAPRMPDLTSMESGGAREFAVAEGERRLGQPSAPGMPQSAAWAAGAQPQASVAPAVPVQVGQPPAPGAVPPQALAQAVSPQSVAPVGQAQPAALARARAILEDPKVPTIVKQMVLGQLQEVMKPQDPLVAEGRRLENDLKRKQLTGNPDEAEGKRLDNDLKRKTLGKPGDAPTTKVIKQADGSEVAVQWDAQNQAWVPLVAPQGGNAVGGAPANPYALPGKPTEDQGKSAGFANRMVESHNIISSLEGVGTDKTQATIGMIPWVGNSLSSADKQRFEQGKRNFVTAILRKESGAAISPGEFDTEEKKYFPQVGDKPEVVEQKRVARETAIQSVMASAGSGYKVPDAFKPGKKAEAPAVDTSKPGSFKWNPATGKMEPA